MANATISASEEVQRYYRKANENAKQLFNQFWTKTGDSEGANKLPAEEEDEEMFDEDIDELDEDWTYIRSSVDIGTEDHAEKYRLATGTGPLHEMQGKLGETAIEMAFKAAGTTGNYIKHGMTLIAEDIGYYATFPTAEDAVRRLLARNPFLTTVQRSFVKGQSDARKAILSEQRPTATVSVSETQHTTVPTPPQTPASRHRQEMERRFAGFEEVPILPPEQEGDQEWEQFQ